MRWLKINSMQVKYNQIPKGLIEIIREAIISKSFTIDHASHTCIKILICKESITDSQGTIQEARWHQVTHLSTTKGPNLSLREFLNFENILLMLHKSMNNTKRFYMVGFCFLDCLNFCTKCQVCKAGKTSLEVIYHLQPMKFGFDLSPLAT